MSLLKKIVKVMVEENPIGRTSLAQAANVHYSRLVEQLAWLEHKHYVGIVFRNGKVTYSLTHEGREFAMKLMSLED